jgi:geranylgeranyl diphosphate synthase type II
MNELKEEFEGFLNDYIQYSEIFKGGKRIRPIIILEIANYINPHWRMNPVYYNKIKRFAITLELIHCTSLIIDDLPSMDNDMYRRNELTFHAKHGRHSAYMMVFNMLILIKKLIHENDDHSMMYLELEELINLEMSNLVNGQKYDLDSSWNKGSRTLKIAELKTASLFKLATLGPFYLLNDDNNNQYKNQNNNQLKEKLSVLGTHLGMAFQLSDDFIDMEIDNSSNNYGLETSPEQLINKYIEYINLIKLNLKDLKFKKTSVIYTILSLMTKRFKN